nr:ETX/MTX2 family pore-forming toxin [uncultured Rhodopila sp.]
MADTQTNVAYVLSDRINSSASKWWEQMWAWTLTHNPNVGRDRFDPTPNGVVYDISSDDLGLVLSDFTFSAVDGTKATEIIGSKNFQNDGNATITDSFTYSTTKTESFTLKFTEGLKVGLKAEVKAGFGFIIGAKVTVSGEITFNSEQSWTSQVAETFGDTITITVPPKTRLLASAVLNLEKGRFNFRGVATATNLKNIVQMGFRLKEGGFNSWNIPLEVLLPADADRQVPVAGIVDGALAVSVTVTTT